MYFVLCTTTYAFGSAVSHMCFRDAKAQELPRLNRSSMHNLATGTFIFCDPGVCQVSISVRTQIETITKAEIRPSVQKSVCTHPHAKVLTAIEVITH